MHDMTITANPVTAFPGEPVRLRANAPDTTVRDTLHFEWSSAAGSFLNATASDTTWIAPTTPGSYAVGVVVRDTHGNVKDLAATIDVVSCLDEPAFCPPNVVMILTDDQPANTTWSMANFNRRLAKNGILFENAFVTDPECCPMRAAFFGGGFRPSQTGVKRNNNLNGGSITRFNDVPTLPHNLQRRGYATGFVGKYVNGYVTGVVPPGWTSFVANNEQALNQDWFVLQDTTFGASTTERTEGVVVAQINQYATDFHRDQAVKFIEKSAGRPFFLSVNFFAPHRPRVPAYEDKGTFASRATEFPLVVAESDVSDKPVWVRQLSARACSTGAALATQNAESLQAVDRALEHIFSVLEAEGIAGNTVVIFASDNGFTMGEHQLPCDKFYAYEPSIHVPLAMWFPGVPAQAVVEQVSVDLDVPATIYDLTDTDAPTEGVSLFSVARQAIYVPVRQLHFIENYGGLEHHFKAMAIDQWSLWAGVRVQTPTERWKYIEHGIGDTELYDLVQDPHELENLHGQAPYANLERDLAAWVADRKGLAMTTVFPPVGTVGQYYQWDMKAWGGVPPYRWDVANGKLPAGLALDPATGRISGVPKEVVSKVIRLRVTDSQPGLQSLKRQEFQYEMRFTMQ